MSFYVHDFEITHSIMVLILFNFICASLLLVMVFFFFTARFAVKWYFHTHKCLISALYVWHIGLARFFVEGDGRHTVPYAIGTKQETKTTLTQKSKAKWEIYHFLAFGAADGCDVSKSLV